MSPELFRANLNCAAPEHHMTGVKTELTLSNDSKKEPPGLPRWPNFLNSVFQATLRRLKNTVYYMPSKPDESLPNTPETAVAKIGITITSIRPIAAAMRPYSIAVAPDSSFMKLTNFFIITLSKITLQHLAPLQRCFMRRLCEPWDDHKRHLLMPSKSSSSAEYLRYYISLLVIDLMYYSVIF